ncbi:hypothetical protein MVEG_02937 [Podila verticillata NRRL 6337]|nr:hypothetical protein MVEG_02937 [Podila verticillata NRRL 6337]
MHALVWVFWLSPPQIQVVPVAAALVPYAKKVRRQFHDASYYLDVDISDNELNKMIRNAEVTQYNFVFVVGAEEKRLSMVNVWSCDGSLEDCIGWMDP